MSVESAADERIWSVPRADARSDARAGESAKLVRWLSAGSGDGGQERRSRSRRGAGV